MLSPDIPAVLLTEANILNYGSPLDGKIASGIVCTSVKPGGLLPAWLHIQHGKLLVTRRSIEFEYSFKDKAAAHKGPCQLDVD